MWCGIQCLLYNIIYNVYYILYNVRVSSERASEVYSDDTLVVFSKLSSMLDINRSRWLMIQWLHLWSASVNKSHYVQYWCWQRCKQSLRQYFSRTGTGLHSLLWGWEIMDHLNHHLDFPDMERAVRWFHFLYRNVLCVWIVMYAIRCVFVYFLCYVYVQLWLTGLIFALIVEHEPHTICLHQICPTICLQMDLSCCHLHLPPDPPLSAVHIFSRSVFQFPCCWCYIPNVKMCANLAVFALVICVKKHLQGFMI